MNAFRISDNWTFRSLKDILTNPPPPTPPWIIEGMVAKNCPTLVSSQPHGMKSFSWLQASIEAALGMPIWGQYKAHDVTKTLFLETEDPPWLLDQRVVFIANGSGINPDEISDGGFYRGHLGAFDLVKAEEDIKKQLNLYKPEMCVLSTLQGLLGGRDWKEQVDMYDVNAMIVRLSLEYCPMIVITHSPQDKKLKRAAGTITQAANYPNILHYDKCHSDSGSYSRVFLDSKLGQDGKFRIRLNKQSETSMRFQWECDVDTTELKQFVYEHPQLSVADIALQFDVSDRYVRRIKSAGTSSGTTFSEKRNKKRNSNGNGSAFISTI